MTTILSLALRLYRAWPLRPHCSATRHVALCRGLHLEDSWCPAKDA